MNKTCSMEGCGSPVLAKGMCGKHYARVRRTGSPDLAIRVPTPCSVCGRQRSTPYIIEDGRVCDACYRRSQRAADWRTGVCLSCGTEYTSKRKYSAESGRGMFCSRECKGAYRVADGRAAESSRKHYYKSRYGLSPEQVKAMRDSGVCDICGETAGVGRWGVLHIDHDHDSGAVRGVLCSRCNTGIGSMGEDPVRLRAAADYLEKTRARLPKERTTAMTTIDFTP